MSAVASGLCHLRLIAASAVIILSLSSCVRTGRAYVEDGQVDVSRWYELKIGESMVIGPYRDIMRVPGGWVISLDKGSWGGRAAFIPYSEEGNR